MGFCVTSPTPTLTWPYMVPPGTWDIFACLLRWALSFCSSSWWPRAVISCHRPRVLMHPPPAPAEPRGHPQVQGSTQEGPELAWLSVKSTRCLRQISTPWALAPPQSRARRWVQGWTPVLGPCLLSLNRSRLLGAAKSGRGMQRELKAPVEMDSSPGLGRQHCYGDI